MRRVLLILVALAIGCLPNSLSAAIVYDIPIIWAASAKNAVHFDGIKQLGLARLFNLDIYNVPPYTDNIALHYWYRSNTPTPNGQIEGAIFNADNDTTINNNGTGLPAGELPVYISHTYDQPSGNVYLTVGVWIESCCDVNGLTLYNRLSWQSVDPLPYGIFDTCCHPIAISISQVHLYNNSTGVSQASAQYALDNNTPRDFMPIDNFVPHGVTIHGIPLYLVTGWQVGGDVEAEAAGFPTFFVGDLAELYVDFNHREDIGPAWLASFRTASGKAVGLGTNCTNPTGSIPNLCLRGDPIWFPRGPKIGANIAYKFVVLPDGGNAHLDPVLDSDPCQVTKIGLARPLFQTGCP